MEATKMHNEIMQLIKAVRGRGLTEVSALAFLIAEMYVEMTDTQRGRVFLRILEEEK